MRRRDFLIEAAATTAITLHPGLLRARATQSSRREAILKGFIVSDAHFGWKHEQQPAPTEQQEMMRRIMRRFPDLDLFIDTGDAHHSGANDEARGHWTDLIAGGCGTLPFYYIAGNHEIIPTCGLDPEWRCNRLGSVPCRPYYSFDLKGIHFVSLPEMERAVLVNRESMEWLALDLEVHKDRTVLILTHNNILGTTCPLGEFGYRGLVNSPQVLELLRPYPNVIGWLNGHNHTYEVMHRDHRLYVSNGRIGGFIPPAGWGPVGQGHLGGIYFEVTPDRFAVRCYSATKERFLDELGDAHLSGAIEGPTTLDVSAPPTYSYGAGGSRDGQRIPVIHHFATNHQPAELFLAGTNDSSFNDDPEFALYQLREHPSLGPHHQLMGASVQLNPRWGEMWVENTVYEWLNPGIRFLPRTSQRDITRMSVPLIDHGAATYYRCPPGRRYRVSLDLETKEGGQQLKLLFDIHDRKQRKLVTLNGPSWTIQSGRHTLTGEIQLPDLTDADCIYNNLASDNTVHLRVMTEISNLTAELTLHRFALSFADAEGPTRNPGLRIDDRRYHHPGQLAPNQITRIRIDPPTSNRTVIEPQAEGSRRVTWLIRHTAPDWQVRNAPVDDQGTHLHVGPMRNTFSRNPEIILAPMTRTHLPFVHRLRHVDEARVYPLQRGHERLKVEIIRCGKACEIEIASADQPRTVTGATSWNHQGNRLILQAAAGSTIEIDFGPGGAT